MTDRAAVPTAIVTGGGRGLGFAITRELVAAGWCVHAVSRTTSPGLAEFAAEQPRLVRPHTFDLAELDGIPALVRRLDEAEPVDALVNCAAVAHDDLLLSQPAAELEAMLRVNLLSPVLLARELAKPMIRRRHGRIVNISSISAHAAMKGLGGYGASKAGLELATRVLAVELAPRGIAVNAVAPGFLRTDMSSSLGEERIAAVQRRTPTGRLVTLEEVSDVVTYLVTAAPQSLTGQVIDVDGGYAR